MRRFVFIFSLMALFFSVGSSAENKPAPIITVSDIYYDEEIGYWGIDVGMDNEGCSVSTLQFDVAFDDRFLFFKALFYKDRFVDANGMLDNDRAVHWPETYLPNARLLSYSLQNMPIAKNSGNLFFLLMIPVDDAQVDINERYPANITNQVFSEIAADNTFSPVYPQPIINDSTLTCHDSMGDYAVAYGDILANGLYDIYENVVTNERLTCIDLEKCTSPFIPYLTSQNPNTLILAPTAPSVLENTVNVLHKDDLGYWRSDAITLADNSKAFALPHKALAAKFSFGREFPVYWSTVILPSTLSPAQFASLRQSDIELLRLSNFNPLTSEVTFSPVESFQSNVPYLVKHNQGGKLFDILENVELQSSDRMVVDSVGGLQMRGSYTYQTLSSSDSITYYGYDSSSGDFVKIGKNARLSPFRCYLALPHSNSMSFAANRLYMRKGEPTEIEGIATGSGHNAGKAYTIDGKLVAPGGSAQRNGVYIIDGKKTILNR